MKEKKDFEQEKSSQELSELSNLLKELKELKKEISKCAGCDELEARLYKLEKTSSKEREEEIELIKKQLETLKAITKYTVKKGRTFKKDNKQEKLKKAADEGRQQAALTVEELVEKAVPPFLR